MDVIIVSQYLRDIENFDDNNSRFVYLSKLLAENSENKVEIITSDFNHSTKKHFSNIGQISKIKVTALHESGYSKNVSIRRFLSHKGLAKSIGKYLNKRNKPDVCYCAVPSLDVANTVALYCKKNDVRFIIDVQDLWPEAFKMVFNVPILSSLIFYPMKKKANKIYELADTVVAVSETYVDRVKEVNKNANSYAVYLGTEKESFDCQADSVVRNNDTFTVAYVGSMSASYNLTSVIDAIAIMKPSIKVKLLAMGDGALKDSFIRYAKEKRVDAEFTGKLPYFQMVKRLLTCDVAVNPIRKGSAGSIINKVGDYAMAGLPVVNTQESPEYRDLLAQYSAGINCECENFYEIACALEKLALDPELRAQMSVNSRKLGTDRFDRKNTYNKLVEELFSNDVQFVY